MPTTRPPSALSALLMGMASSIGVNVAPTATSASLDDPMPISSADSTSATTESSTSDHHTATPPLQLPTEPASEPTSPAASADKPPHSAPTPNSDEDDNQVQLDLDGDHQVEPCLLSPTLFHSLPDDHDLALSAAVEADPMHLPFDLMSTSTDLSSPTRHNFPTNTHSGNDPCTSSPLRKRRRCGTVERNVTALLPSASNQSLASAFDDAHDNDTDSALALHSRSSSRRHSPAVHLSSSAPSSYASAKRRVYGPLPPLSFDVSSIPPYCPKRAVYTWLNKSTRHVDPPSAFGCLHPGAVFSGSQRSGANEYTVQVRLVNVDLGRSHLSAFLDINGLTAVQPDITTYLEAEIIGPHHSFLTKRWEADESVDREHWRKFPEFRNEVGDQFKQEGYVYDSRATDIVFMRWKELFLVPDHSQTSIDGASFSGFYYIACNVRSGAIVGYYYSANSEWFQRLDLDYEPARGIPSFEFR